VANERGSGIGRGCILVFILGGLALMFGLVGLALPYWLFARSSSVVEPPIVEAPAPSDGAPEVGSPDAQPIDPSAKGPAIARIVSRRTLLVGMDTGEPAWTGKPPLYFPNNRGEPDGLDVAVAHRIADALGVQPKIVHGRYADLTGTLVDPSARVDLVISGFAPGEHEGITWSEPYLEYGLCLVVSSKSKIKTLKELTNTSIGIPDDQATADQVSKLVKGYAELVPLESGYWDQLVSGRLDAFLYDYPHAVSELSHWYGQNPSRKGSLRIAQYNLTSESYAVGVRTTEPELLAVVNEAIAGWRASDAYPAAIGRYLQGGEAVEPPAAGKFVVVAEGETLAAIAARELGAVEQWPELWALNRGRFPNPHLIDPGDRIQLPQAP
jgi:ABC-type amino acid transport substrate-binding protein